MSFREKLVWGQLCASLTIWGGYLLWVRIAWPRRGLWSDGIWPTGFIQHTLTTFILCLFLSILVSAALALATRFLTPKAERNARDERERAARQRAGAWAFNLLWLWLIAATCWIAGLGTFFEGIFRTAPNPAPSQVLPGSWMANMIWDAAHWMLLAVVVSSVFRAVAELVLLRRGR
jgi:hypothetical protein